MIISLITLAVFIVPILMIITVVVNTVIETKERKARMAAWIVNYTERMDRRDGLPVDARWTDDEALALASL